MCEINRKYQVPDQLWQKIKKHIPVKIKKKPGRPAMDDRKAFNAILYILHTGCQWKALPRSLGASSTVHDRFQFWREQGFFQRLWQEGVLEYSKFKGIDWQWQCADGSHVAAKLGGKSVGPSYKYRAKNGTNRSLLTEGNGIPLALVIDKANCNDFKLLEPTLKSLIVDRPELPTPQHICLDKGYDCFEVDQLVKAWGYTAHIRRKGEDSLHKPIPKLKARRWVVERTYAWLNNFRRLLTRWEKKDDNYLAFLHLGCSWISYRAASAF